METSITRRKFIRDFTLGSLASAGIGSHLIAGGEVSSQKDRPPVKVKPVNELCPYQLESGIATDDENSFVEKWLSMVTGDSLREGGRWYEWISTDVPFSFIYNGRNSKDVLMQCAFRRRDIPSEDRVTTEIEFDDTLTGLRLKWEIRRFIGYPALDWVLYIKNVGSVESPIVEDIQPLDLRMIHHAVGRPYTVHGAIRGQQVDDDLMPFSTYLPDPPHTKGELVMGRRPFSESSLYHLPFFNVESPENRGVIIGIGWSGDWIAHLGVDGSELRAKAGMKRTHFSLRPGESVRTPRAVVLMWRGRQLHGHNMFRQVMHRFFAPHLTGRQQVPMVTTNACFFYHSDGHFLEQASTEKLMPLVKPAIDIGSEMLIIDAGWHEGADGGDERGAFPAPDAYDGSVYVWKKGMGDWRYSRSRFPNGFTSLSEAFKKALGGFGLWFAPELVSRDTPVQREHPEFTRDGNKRMTFLRMDLPEAREWFLKYIDDYVRNHGLTCFREDQGTHFPSEAANRVGITEALHYGGFYELLDEMRRRHPNLVMEAGGLMIGLDLEAVSRFNWGQMIDHRFIPEIDHCNLYGVNLYLPGGICTMFTAATDDYGTWSSFAGQFSPAWDLIDPQFPWEKARKQVERYKRIRGYLSGDFYPLTPCSTDSEWIGFQFHRSDLDGGFALIFRRRDERSRLFPDDGTINVKLRGLRPGTYSVKFEATDDAEDWKSEMLSNGFALQVKSPPAAEMIVYQISG